jgi:DNA mismatch endonuclease (patch repair protein)
MADVHSVETRSFNMSQIKGKHTRPEIVVRKFLHNNGFRFGLHSRSLPGKPDIVLKKYKTIVDVRGCFWHAHKNCKYGDKVKTESVEIAGRIKSAVERDKIKTRQWKKLGWNVIVLWDSCELEIKKKNSPKRERILIGLIQKLRKIGDTGN